MTLIELVEAFESRLDLQWQHVKGGGEAAGFAVNDVQYMLQLLPIKVAGVEAIEASFVNMSVDGDKAFNTGIKTSASDSATSVYGIVINGIVDRLEKYDAVYLTANRRHALDQDQHMRKIDIYASMAKRFAKRVGWELYRDGDRFLVTREYKGEMIESFKHWQKEMKEALGNPENFPTLRRGK